MIDGTSQTQNPVIIIITKYANKMQKYRRPKSPRVHNPFYDLDFIMKRLNMSLEHNPHVAAA